MRKVSTAYKRAMAKNLRDHAYMVVSVGIISNHAQGSAQIVSPTLYLSNNKYLFRAKEISTEYATFEENQTKADGKALFPPKNDEIFQLVENTNAISQDIRGHIMVRFDNEYLIKGLTIDFGDSYPTEFRVVINEETTYTYLNDTNRFVTDVSFNKVRTIKIIPIHFVDGDDKRLRINTMLMGVGVAFQNEDIESATLTDTASFISEELPQLEFSVTCFDKDKIFNVDDDNSFIQFLERGQELNVTIGVELENGSIEWLDMPLTYLDEWASDTQRISFTSTDKIALMTPKYDAGNYIHERTLYSDAVDVCTFFGLEPDEYYIDDSLRNVVVENPLPAVSCAECLQLIANAGRCAIKQNSDGMILLLPNFENIVDPLDIVVETEDEAYWSDAPQIRQGSSFIYADFTLNFASADGSFFFVPHENEEILESGFVSESIADDNGEFTNNPKVSMQLEATYTYFGIDFEFGGNPPEEFVVRTYDEGTLVDEVIATDVTNEYFLNEIFRDFDKIEFEFTKTYPRNRIVLQRVSFGMLSDYELKRQDMMQNPIGTVEPKTQSVSVRVFTFEEEIDQDDNVRTKQVDDDVYYTYVLGTVGESVTFENQLISTMEHAEEVAEWLANYYANNITYEVNYRGEPRLESLDYIYMDSEILNNLQVEIESLTLNFNGALSGSLELRRAINMIRPDE